MKDVRRRSQDWEEPTDKKYRTRNQVIIMNPFESLIGHDVFSVVLGLVLVMGVLAFARFDLRRTSRLPHLGTVLVKNRLKSFGSPPNRH